MKLYLVREKPGNDKKAFSIYGRLKMFTSQMADVTRGNPGSYHEVKDRHLQDMKGMNDRNFSFGERINFSAPANKNPGSVYLIPSFCDKFKRVQKKLSPKKLN